MVCVHEDRVLAGPRRWLIASDDKRIQVIVIVGEPVNVRRQVSTGGSNRACSFSATGALTLQLGHKLEKISPRRLGQRLENDEGDIWPQAVCPKPWYLATAHRSPNLLVAVTRQPASCTRMGLRGPPIRRALTGRRRHDPGWPPRRHAEVDGKSIISCAPSCRLGRFIRLRPVRSSAGGTSGIECAEGCLLLPVGL
jgi:hypothetical protein